MRTGWGKHHNSRSAVESWGHSRVAGRVRESRTRWAQGSGRRFVVGRIQYARGGGIAGRLEARRMEVPVRVSTWALCEVRDNSTRTYF